MSFAVKPNPKDDPMVAYIIKLQGVKKPFKSKDLRGVTEAMTHYFTDSHNHTYEHCPICQRGVGNE